MKNTIGAIMAAAITIPLLANADDAPGPVEVALRRTAEEQAAAASIDLEFHRGGDGHAFVVSAMEAKANPFVALHNALARGPALNTQLLAEVSQQAQAEAYTLKAQLEADEKSASAQFARQPFDKAAYDTSLNEFAARHEKLGTVFDRIIAFNNQARAWIEEQQVIRQEQQERQLNAAQATAEDALRAARAAQAEASAARAVAAKAQNDAYFNSIRH